MLRRTVIEKVPSLRYRTWQLLSRTLFASIFAEFGEGSVLHAPKILRGTQRIRIGRDCIIHAGIWLQLEEDGDSISIGDRTYIGHRAHIHAGTAIQVGAGCVIADDVFIASVDHARHGDRHLVTNTSPITIGDNVFIGQRAIILGGVTIGDGATIGAGAVVTRDVAPNGVVAGSPARPISSRSESTRNPAQ